MKRTACTTLVDVALGVMSCAGLLSIVFGCGPMVVDPMPDIPENVSYDTVRIEYGTDDALEATPEDAMTTKQQGLVGNLSDLAAFTSLTVGDTNEIVYDVFRWIESITATPAAAYDAETDTWTWVHEKPLRGIYMRFELTRDPIPEPLVADDAPVVSAISFKFFYGRDEADNAQVYSGYYHAFDASTPAGQRQRGYGVVRLFLGELSAYDASTPRGTMRIAFRSNNGVRQVLTSLSGVEDRSDEPLDALYSYVQLDDAQGRFRYYGRSDFDDDAEFEFFSVRSAWTAGRQGRAAARITGGSLGRSAIELEQCWDLQQITVWERVRSENPRNMREISVREDGFADDCADPLRALSLSPPAYIPTEDEDPPIPEPLEADPFR